MVDTFCLRGKNRPAGRDGGFELYIIRPSKISLTFEEPKGCRLRVQIFGSTGNTNGKRVYERKIDEYEAVIAKESMMRVFTIAGDPFYQRPRSEQRRLKQLRARKRARDARRVENRAPGAEDGGNETKLI